MTDLAIYRGAKATLVDYVSRLDSEALHLTCDACPDWSIKDTVAHHIHAQRSLVDSTFPSAAHAAIVAANADERAVSETKRDAWTANGVSERSGRTLEQLLAEWDQVEQILMTSDVTALVADLTVHLDDIRETLVGHVARSGDDIGFTLARYHHFQSKRYEVMGVPAVGIECADTGQRLEADGPGVVLGDSYDVLRCLVGRRTRPDADAMLKWGETTEETRDGFSVFGWKD